MQQIGVSRPETRASSGLTRAPGGLRFVTLRRFRRHAARVIIVSLPVLVIVMVYVAVRLQH